MTTDRATAGTLSLVALISLACGVSGNHPEDAGLSPSELSKVMEVMEDNGVVLVVPGQEPRLIAKAGHLTFRGLSGKVEFLHPVEDGWPLPAESESAVATFAGPGAVPVADDLLLAWRFELEPRGKSQLGRFSRLMVEDITGDEAVVLADGVPERSGSNLTLVTDGEPLTSKSFPWMFTTDPNTLVLRITLSSEHGSQEVLMQPVVIQPSFKMQAQQMHGLIHG